MTSDTAPGSSVHLNDVNMAVEDVIVGYFVKFWRLPAVRRYFHWMFLFLTLLGSLLKELDVVPQSYFSHRRNAINVYFIKLSWGWTLLLLTPFLLLVNSLFSRSVSFLGRRVCALLVATGIWYVCTATFVYIENVTGSCYETETMAVLKKEFTFKASCKQAGLHWDGFDISGHAFILAYSALLIMEEMAPMGSMMAVSYSALPRMALNFLYIALNLIVIIWVWMFACTAVYFHDLSHKLIGTVCGLSAWFLTYRLWYLKPLSPGLPPVRHLKGQKQHA
uniref:Fat storage inducing transmembrane protein 2 n=1 Tax=Takifugu rubripes TaxID=31033 RepID=A0A3B5JWT4_TAKRU